FAWRAESDVAIVCAGSDDRVSLEDLLCAGLILHQLWNGTEPAQRSDAAHIALTQYTHDRDDLASAIARSNHARRLVGLGFADDVAYCAQVDALPLLPVYREGRVVLADPTAAAVSSKTIPATAD